MARKDSRIAITVVSIVFGHVMFSNYIQLILFFQIGRRGTKRVSSAKIKKSTIRLHQREKVCNIYILLNKV